MKAETEKAHWTHTLFVENVEYAIEYAASEGVEAEFLTGDAVSIDRLLVDSPAFDACINMFTSHSYYGRDGDVRMFSGVGQLTRVGGVLIVMTIHRDYLVKNFAPEEWQTAGEYCIFERRRLDLEKSHVFNTWDFYHNEERIPHLRLRLDFDNRVYSLHEVRSLLEEAGWTYRRGLGTERWDSVELTPLEIDSSRMWVVAQR